VSIEESGRSQSRFPLTDKSALWQLRRQIRDDFDRVDADPSLVFECLVSVTEACTNALMHGLREAHIEQDDPQVTWTIQPEGALFTIRDFSARRWSDRRAEEEPAEPPAGGYGIDLMPKLMDAVTNETDGEGTTVRLRKRLGAV
jgi:anti-sigma regulatory factor (Ser/Thr protein kinase)